MLEATAPSSNVPTVDVTCPWLGLLPFTEFTTGFFFGRDAEIAEIHDRIEENILTTLFGQSGLGKTSLLGAGVLPRLRNSGRSPVLLRLDHDPAAPSLLDQTRTALQQALPGIDWPDDASSVTLWELVHRQPFLVPPGAATPVLIFDQFEEIFTLGRQDPAREAGAVAWLEQIADLIQCRPPKSLEARFAGNRKLARDYDFGRCPVRFVFSLREDYLSNLEEWKATLPLLVQNRMPLRLLDGPQALEAVIGPASLGHAPLVSREVAASIVRTVARVPAETPLAKIRAVPPLLSLLCEQLNSARLAAGATQIDASMVSERSEDILHHFYEESFASFPESHRDKIRSVIEDRMITVGGHRHPVAREDAEAELAGQGIPHPAAIFDTLIHRRLLTVEEHGGLQRLEITHDVLVPLIVRSRKERRERQEREVFERQLAEEAAKARKRRIVIASMAVLTVLALASAASALILKGKADGLVVEINHTEGLGWLQRSKVAGEQEKRFPDTLLYAAQAIGFEGSAGVGAGKKLESLIQKRTGEGNGDRNNDPYADAQSQITGQPSYLPVWGKTLGSKISGLSFSPGGRELAIGTLDGSVRLCDFATGADRELVLDETGPVFDLAFQPFGTRLATARKGTISVSDTAGAGEVTRLPVDARRIAYSPDGAILAAARADGRIELLRDGSMRTLETGCADPPSTVGFSDDRQILAAAFPGFGARIAFPAVDAVGYSWPPSGMAVRDSSKIPPLSVSAVALSPDGRHLAYGTEDGNIVIWDTLKTRPLGQISPVVRHQRAIRDLRFRADGLQLASASDDGFIKLWDMRNSSPSIIATLTGHIGAVTIIRYAPGADLLASGGVDGRVKLWDVSGKKRATLDLLGYIANESYRFEAGGSLEVGPEDIPWINVPAASIASHWRSNSNQVFFTLRDAGDRSGSAAALETLPDDARGKATDELAAAWLDGARLAATNFDWNVANLRLSQITRGGLHLPPGEATPELEKSRSAREGENFTNSERMGFVWCNAGTFQMGSPAQPKENGRADEGETLHEVKLTRGFWIGSHEVTQAQWQSIMENNPSISTKAGLDAPVENIDWHEAIEFCHKLTDHERFLGLISEGWEYSLPTHAQWEYACRAGSSTAYSFGPDRAELYLYGNYRDVSFGESVGPRPEESKMTKEDWKTDWEGNDGHVLTAPVGSFRPNPWGLFDMHGNVAEWCLDHVDMSNRMNLGPEDEGAKREDPFVGPAPERLDRKFANGSWNDSRNDNRSAKSGSLRSTTKKWTIGMRVVLVPIRREP